MHFKPISLFPVDRRVLQSSFSYYLSHVGKLFPPPLPIFFYSLQTAEAGAVNLFLSRQASDLGKVSLTPSGSYRTPAQGKFSLNGVYLRLIELNYHLHWRSSSTTLWHLSSVEALAVPALVALAGCTQCGHTACLLRGCALPPRLSEAQRGQTTLEQFLVACR